MEKIAKVLDIPIKRGYVNWPKLEAKIHTVLKLTGNKLDRIIDDSKVTKLKFEDAIVTHIKTEDNQKFVYKLFEPRFKDGDLYCSGFMMGYDTGKDPIWNFKTLVRF